VIPFTTRSGETFTETLNPWIARARSVGYDGFIIDVSNMEKPAPISRMLQDTADAFDGFKIFTRKTIILQERQSIKERLANIRDKSGVNFICIRSSNADVLNFAAKDSRIDIIRLETPTEIQAFSEGIASLASQEGKFIELPFAPLFKTRGAGRSKFIREANKVLEITLHKHVRLLFSSDASHLTDVKNAWQRVIALNIVLGASRQVARDIFLKHPFQLLERNSRENVMNVASASSEPNGEDE